MIGMHRRWLAWYLGIAAAACASHPAAAQSLSDIGKQLEQMRQELQVQRAQIASQTQRIQQQEQEIARLENAPVVVAPPVKPLSADAAPPPRFAVAANALPDLPVGDAPEPARAQQTQALPEGVSVLTRSGHAVLEPSLEYTNSSSNRLIFQGIELVPGIQIGLIQAGTADRNTLVAAMTARYGLTNRLEVDARVPYLYRSDRIDGVQQQLTANANEYHLTQHGLGDIEFGLRYQFNRPVGERPIFIGGLQVKSNTGKSPFAVPFDSSGVALGLATGSGFWAVQPSLSFLLPSDPAVIFGGVSYLYDFSRAVDRTIGMLYIRRVFPGDAVTGNIGFGFAINPRFSFSLGYEHSYIFPTRWQINGEANATTALQVGTIMLGLSYRLTPRQVLNFAVQVGATRDAPDVGIVLRVPFLPS